jgi:hypothetical protein
MDFDTFYPFLRICWGWIFKKKIPQFKGKDDNKRNEITFECRFKALKRRRKGKPFCIRSFKPSSFGAGGR